MTANQSAPLLQIEDLSVQYRTAKHLVHAVRNVSLTIGAGETVALVGESGSGKSTTAHAINRLLPAAASVTGGAIRLQGQDLGDLSDRSFRSVRGRRISLVPQDPTVSLNPVLRIGEQVGEVLKIHGLVDRRDVDAHVLQALTDAGVDRAELRAQQYPHQLSGGLRQRVLIAIAIVARPDLIVADEPTSALDVTVQRQILDHIEQLATDLGTGVLLVTHDLGVAADRAHRIAVMSQGRIVETGVPAQILGDPQHPYTRNLIEAAPSLNTSRRLPSSRPDAQLDARTGEPLDARTDTPPDALPAPAAPGRRPGDPFGTGPEGVGRGTRWPLPWRRRAAATATPRAGEQVLPAGLAPSGDAGDLEVAPPLLQAEGLVKDYPVPRSVVPSGTLRAVDGVSIAIGRGRTLALVGESGSGKSTTARLVLRLLEPTAGRILYNGEDVTHWHGAQLRELRRRIQVVQQNPYASLDPRLNVATLISEPLAALKLGSRTQRATRARELLDLVGLPASFARRRPAALSGGQRQRVAIARALAVDPELVVLDEPVSALDVRVQSQILDLLQRLQQDLAVSYLFISHDLAVVRQVAHEIGVMKSARLLEAGPAEAVFRRPRTEYTKELLAAIPGTRTHV